VTSGNYGGDHWLASFAVYAIFDWINDTMILQKILINL
jgi:hypothetical protein